jgi:hypothetical protein
VLSNLFLRGVTGRRRAFGALALAAIAGAGAAQPPAPSGLGEAWRDRLSGAFDPVDGQLDLSAFLERAAGFLPVPLIVTEPAVGYGGGLLALFVRPRREAGNEGYARPDLSAVGGIRTQNGTHLAFVGDASRWMDGRLRTLGGAGGGAINLDIFGLGGQPPGSDTPIRYTLDVKAIGGQVDWQLAPGSPWSIGARLVYAEVVPKLRDEPLIPGLEDRTQARIAGPGIALTYDTRDTVFTPTRGYYVDAGLIVSDETFGATREFRRFDGVAIGYWPVHAKITLAARADYQQVSVGAPFYVRPFIALRGIPAMRYPGDRVVSTELEARWQFLGRWSVLAFGGVGQARLDSGPLRRDRTAGAGGVGFRYELARRFGLHAGIDVARGPEETAVYLQVGSAWFRP